MGSASWQAHVLASRAQTLEDLATAQMASVAVIAGDEAESLIDPLRDGAIEAGFAVAFCSLAQHSLHDLDQVVRALAGSLRVPKVDAGRRNGLVAALDAFLAVHKKRSVQVFEERAEAEGASGELSALLLEYLSAHTGNAPARRLQAWLGGRDVSAEAAELRPLEAATSKRALAQLTRVVRVLGHRGLRVILRDAEALIDLAPGRRDVAYTVLRELIDNTDGGQGMVGAELLLIGSPALERRVHSLMEHPALRSRIDAVVAEGPPIPHQTWISLAALPTLVPPVPELRTTDPRRSSALRALIRIAQGLPPLEAVPELTVGMEQVDERIAQLFAHATNDGSVFAVLCGEYGAGKTHHLLHLQSRALAERRPVLRLAVERLDEDLGNPQRHLRRLIEGALVPAARGRPAAMLDRLDEWLAKSAKRQRLREVLEELGRSESEAARAARSISGGADLDDAAVRETLGAIDLVDKPSNSSYRKDAYGRLQLWLELLARLDGCEGPVLVLDEAENLYRAGVSRPERRTALRSLAYYCGGSIARACVVLAVTPDTLEALREEAGALLVEIEDQATLLPSEDVAMLRRRLLRARPIAVTQLQKAELGALAEQARRLASDVRGRRRDPDWDEFLARALRECETPRDLVRRVAARSERAAWLA